MCDEDEEAGRTPCTSIKEVDAKNFFPAGPPYMIALSDMKKLAKDWEDFTLIYANATDENILSDMFAFSLAAIKHGLPHDLYQDLFVSRPEGHGWESIDNKMTDIYGELSEGRVMR